MKIYTKTGDKGMTSLRGGTRVAKNSVRLEAYGSVDELNSYIGWIRSFDINPLLREELAEIQHILFSVGGNLATDPSRETVGIDLGVADENIEILEKAIDRMNAELPPLTSFILPGGTPASSCCQVARTVCRRVERRILDVNTESPVEESVIRYINRLSDYLFMLARKIAYEAGVEELKWEVKK